jgi:ABC-type sugar transport system ATPase subunit
LIAKSVEMIGGAEASNTEMPGRDAARPQGAALVIRNFTKRFPGVLAVDNLDLTVEPGEILALLGQNGAGKSTLIKALAGVYTHGSYEGEIRLGGQPHQPRSISEAEQHGIVLVPQEIAVAPTLNLAENIFLNAEPTRYGFIDGAKRLAMAKKVLRGFAIDLDPATPMSTLDLATQQIVVIARALSKNARVLILDEPTAALTNTEARRLFAHMRTLRARGVSIIFVSHRLGEVFAIADRIAVMRDGRLAGVHATNETSRDAIVMEMVGAVRSGAASGLAAPERGATALDVRGLSVASGGDQSRRFVSDLSFSVARGEILGLFGLLGAGCAEAVLALFGAWQGAVEGRILIDGREVAVNSPADAISLGLGLMAQDRRDALIIDHSIADNISIASLPAVTERGLLNKSKMRRRVADLIGRVGIKASSMDAPVGSLSGGNQQKVQIARWLAADTRILLQIDPTRGVDVGARAEIHDIWRRLAAEGRTIIVTSSEAEELADVCHRVLVLRQGSRVAELAGPHLTEDGLLRAATGV